MNAFEENNLGRVYVSGPSGHCFEDTGLSWQEARSATTTCSICCEETKPSQMFTLACGHACHDICLRKFMETRIEEGHVDNLSCFFCASVATTFDVGGLVSDDHFARYQRYLLKLKVDSNPNLRWCPTPECGTVVERQAEECTLATVAAVAARLVAASGLAFSLAYTMDMPFQMRAISSLIALVLSAAVEFYSRACLEKVGLKATCSKCCESFCFDCGCSWHPHQSCNQIEETALWSWAASRDVGRCPKCQTLIEKNAGCKHMTCRNCNYQFCWHCGVRWSADHICVKPVPWDKIGKLIRGFIPGHPWAPIFAVVLVVLWYTRLLTYCALQKSSQSHTRLVDLLSIVALTVGATGLAALKLVQCFNAWVSSFIGELSLASFSTLRVHLRGAWLHLAIMVAIVTTALWLRSYLGPWGAQWTLVMWAFNIFLAAQAWFLTESPHECHMFPPLRDGRPCFRGHDKVAWVAAPLLFIAVLHLASYACLNFGSAPQIVDLHLLNQTDINDDIRDRDVVKSQPRSVETNITHVFRDVRNACKECSTNLHLDFALLGLQDAMTSMESGRVREVADMKIRLATLEYKMNAMESRGWFNWSLRRPLLWFLISLKPILTFVIVFIGLSGHAVYCFMLVATKLEAEQDFTAMPGKYIFASVRSLSSALLLLLISSSAEWPGMVAGMWWASRIFLPIAIVCLLWEVGDQAVAILVFVGLILTLDLGAWAAAGWPADLVMLSLGGAISMSLAVDAFAPMLKVLLYTQGNLISRVFPSPAGLGVIFGVCLWLTQPLNLMSCETGMVLAGATPTAISFGAACYRKGFFELTKQFLAPEQAQDQRILTNSTTSQEEIPSVV